MVAIGDSLSNITSSDNAEDGEDEDDEQTEQGKLSEDDKPGWVMGTKSHTVQHHIKRFLHNKMKLDELTQPGWGDSAEYFRESDKKYGKSECRVPAVVKQQTNQDAARYAPTTFGEHIECLDIGPGILQMPIGTSRGGCSYIRLGSGNPLLDTGIPSFAPAMEPDSSPMLKAKSFEPVSFYPCILPPQLITIYILDSDKDIVTASPLAEE